MEPWDGKGQASLVFQEFAVLRKRRTAVERDDHCRCTRNWSGVPRHFTFVPVLVLLRTKSCEGDWEDFEKAEYQPEEASPDPTGDLGVDEKSTRTAFGKDFVHTFSSQNCRAPSKYVYTLGTSSVHTTCTRALCVPYQITSHHILRLMCATQNLIYRILLSKGPPPPLQMTYLSKLRKWRDCIVRGSYGAHSTRLWQNFSI